MIRLLGFLVGSAASIGMILLILGLPDIHLSKSLMDEVDLDSLSQTVEAAKTDIEAVAGEMLEEVSEFVNDLPPAEPPIESQPDEPAVSHVGQADDDTPDPARRQPAPDDFDIETASPEGITKGADNNPGINRDHDKDQEDLRWYSFWNPFRSEIAANGFVSQLEKVTGLDYRVVKIKTGVYEVTFAYENDGERRTKLSQIASSTGLDLPES